MEQAKVGKFFASLRKEKDMTQELLGEQLGVTNKTVSRWENGNNMPDISALEKLSEIFGVSIGEIISGERLTDDKLREASDRAIIDAAKNEAFSCKEKLSYWKKKWNKEHFWTNILLVVIVFGIYVALWFFLKDYRVCIAASFGPVCFILSAINSNRKQSYAEKKVFG